jgi:hypothetical protein
MNCAVCGLPIVAERTGRGELLPVLGHEIWVVAGRCPYPACGAQLFAWTEAPEADPTSLTDAAGVRALRLRCALQELATALPSAVVVLGLVVFAVWAALHGVTEARSPGVLALVVGGPAMIVASACGFVVLAVARHGAGDELDPVALAALSSSLKLRPVPRSYRSV